MLHDVVNADVSDIIKSIDCKYSTQSLYNSLLFNHFNSTIKNLIEYDENKRIDLSCNDIIEPLQSFYEFSSITNKSIPKERGPYCKLQHSNVLKNSGINNSEGLYMIIKGDDIVSGLQCNRTYFLHNGGNSKIYDDKTV